MESREAKERRVGGGGGGGGGREGASGIRVDWGCLSRDIIRIHFACDRTFMELNRHWRAAVCAGVDLVTLRPQAWEHGMSLSDVMDRVGVIYPNMTAIQILDSEMATQQLDLSPLMGLLSLREVGLAGNPNLNEVLCRQLARLRRLTRLDLSQTGAGATQNLKALHFTALRDLNLADTALADEGCAHLSGVHALTRLSITGTRVGDAGLAHVCNITSLRALLAGRLQSVQAAGFQQVANLLVLRELDLSWNRNLDSNFCALLAGLTELTSLNLARTAVGDGGCEHLARLVDLECLDLSRNSNINGSGCRALAALAKLRILRLQETALRDEYLPALRDLNTVADLDLDATQVTSSSSWVLSHLMNLSVLSLQYTLVDDIACRYISELHRLRCLKLMMTAVGDPGCEALAHLQKLTELNLSGTKVSNVGCVSLVRISTLETIDLRNTKVTPVGSDILRRLPALREILI